MKGKNHALRKPKARTHLPQRILREIPGFLDIVVRYCYELAMHAIDILGAL